jgi:hypothetical protein
MEQTRQRSFDNSPTHGVLFQQFDTSQNVGDVSDYISFICITIADSLPESDTCFETVTLSKLARIGCTAQSGELRFDETDGVFVLPLFDSEPCREGR